MAGPSSAFRPRRPTARPRDAGPLVGCRRGCGRGPAPRRESGRGSPPGSSRRVRAEVEDVGEDEILRCRFAEGLGCMLGVRLEQGIPVLGTESADHTVAEKRKQIRQAEVDRAGLAEVIPGQIARLRGLEMQHQGLGWPLLAAVPSLPPALLVIGAEGNRVLEGQDLEPTIAQLGQDVLVEQDVIGVRGNPKPREIGRKLPEDAVGPQAHGVSPICPGAATDPAPTRSIMIALRSGRLASAASSEAMRSLCSCSRRLRR